ncbi:KIN17-like protein [Camellia lanceoleosa]|uniref:KIN17-like protein n=1 Tax=Camellia lanceoleosa TaxID=1840588 RepID=A0ACC0J1L5_9ERIC|nr:KIN17-like protein [Camellia lanceoleosa]
MFETKHVLRVDQEELETVIPQIGGIVRIVNGAYCGSNARLLAVDTDKFCAKVQIEKGIYDGRVIKAVEYEDICKRLGFNIATQTVEGYVFVVVATSIMTNWALTKHRRLRMLFDGKEGRSKYP